MAKTFDISKLNTDSTNASQEEINYALDLLRKSNYNDEQQVPIEMELMDNPVIDRCEEIIWESSNESETK